METRAARVLGMSRTSVGLWLLLALPACERTASVGRQFARGTGDADDTTTQSHGTSPANTGAEQESSVTSDPAPTTTTGRVDTSSSSSSSSSSGLGSSSDETTSLADTTSSDTDPPLPPKCDFESPWTRCAICMHAACCDQVRTCQFERECACFWDCFKYNRPRDECSAFCRFSFEQVDEVLFCSNQWCAVECAPLPS